ncbi:MAG: DUF485 domain-containing protein [Neisseriaceae bacterium]|nr:DUF485 domain-containing protein [Neisseriaceae bacterium]
MNHSSTERQAGQSVPPASARPDYARLVATPEFKQLLARKKSFMLPAVCFFLIFYFMLPILATYTTWLQGSTVFGITYVWVFALCQFGVVWGLGWVYVKKATVYDQMAKDVLTENQRELSK